MTTAIKTASELDLPEPAMRAARVGNEAWLFPKVGYYTADQMRDYGRQCAALAAGRAEPEKRADPRQTPLSRLVPIAFASVVDLESYVTMMTIGPHLPGVRDVAMYTKDQLHSAVNAAPSQPVGSARIQIDLTEEEGKAIADLVMAGDEPCEVTLCVGDGCEGHGLYAWQSEYPEEGASFIKTLAALTPEPAALPAEVEPPAYLNATGKDIWRIGFNTALSLAAPAQPAPEGDWLWIKLMDFCKARGFHPGQFNDLFAIVTEARQAKAQAAAVPEAVPLQAFADAVKHGIAAHLSDSQPLRQYDLAEIDEMVRSVEIRADLLIDRLAAPEAGAGGSGVSDQGEAG
jgi:hypothetical protein